MTHDRRASSVLAAAISLLVDDGLALRRMRLSPRVRVVVGRPCRSQTNRSRRHEPTQQPASHHTAESPGRFGLAAVAYDLCRTGIAACPDGQPTSAELALDDRRVIRHHPDGWNVPAADTQRHSGVGVQLEEHRLPSESGAACPVTRLHPSMLGLVVQPHPPSVMKSHSSMPALVGSCSHTPARPRSREAPLRRRAPRVWGARITHP